MKYLLFDQSGDLAARYDSDIHGEAIPTDAVEVSDEIFWRTINETHGAWKREPATGDIARHPFPPPSPAEIEAAKVALVQEHMDTTARALRYDSIANAVTYAEEPAVPRFQAEGRALRAWRSSVWEACYEILDQVQNEGRAVPTDEELIAALPELELPG